MKKNLLVTAVLLLGLPLTASGQEAGSDEQVVRRVVESYLQTGDVGARRRALHPEAKIISVDSAGRGIVENPVSKPARKLPPGATVTQSPQRVVTVDVAEGAATVKVETDFSAAPPPGVTPRKHVQYLSLLKLGGEWKIVSILMPPLRFAEAGR